MGKQSWSDIGDEINNAVDEAIQTEDFSKLSQSIRSAVTAAVGLAADNVRDAAGTVAQSVSTVSDGVARGVNVTLESVARGMDTVADSLDGRQKKKKAAEPQNPWEGKKRPPSVEKTGAGAKDELSPKQLYATGELRTAVGYALSITAALVAAGNALLMIAALSLGLYPFALILLLPILVCVFGYIKGFGILQKDKRFKSYVRTLGNRRCISIAELAASVGKSEDATRNDVRKMIGGGLFRQGHLSPNGKTLFVTNEGYEAYLRDQQRMEQQQAAAALAQEQKKREERKNAEETKGLPEAVWQLVEEGRGYIARIHAANDAIQDEAVSEKLDSLEVVVTKIFQYVAQKPESAADTKKLMKYYLPTTIKLLDSYQKLDAQPIQGPNVLKSKKEIEDTLDTLNQAFARLFDNLFQDTSIDISSDISVLNTLLAQEGLTGERI